MSRQSGKISVPDTLRDLLLEFTINYLLEQPDDVVEFGINYFTKLRDNRQPGGTKVGQSAYSIGSAEDSLSMDDEPPPPTYSSRRKSVFVESYDPEEDDDERDKIVFPKSDTQRKRLADSVANILLFRALDKEQMQEVLDAMFERLVQPEEFIIRQGEDGDNFYVIEKGTYNAYVKRDGTSDPIHVHTYDGSGSFGELALLYNLPRAASVKALTEGSLWAMDRTTFRRICLKSAFKKRQMYERLIETVPILKTLQPYERMNVADALISRTYTAGELIIKQGDAADGMYFVESGEIRITIANQGGGEIEVNRIHSGGYFGELALVTHKPRAASAYAIGDVQLAFLDVGAFERLLGPCMDIMKRNFEDYEEQLEKIFGSKTNINDVR